MAKRIYFILEGSTNSTYIFNAENVDAITYSLKFYKARTVKQKVMKNAFKLYLYCMGLLCRTSSLCILKDKSEVGRYLEKSIDRPMDFKLNEKTSVFISSTRDKIIVHHHGFFFQKFAIGNSYKKVKNEAMIYELLDVPLQNFEVSKFYDHADNENEFCSFKLSSQRKNIKIDINLTSALVEMFNVTKQNECSFTFHLEGLKNRYLKSTIECESVERVLRNFIDNYKNLFIPLGLVHRDFKPWNVNDESGLLIYDFEEAVIDGPPLEDLFNYYIDPIVRYLSPSKVSEKIFEIKNVKEYECYLGKLEINLDFKLLLYCYLIERAIFWMNANEKETSARYCDLFEYIIMEYKGE
jgi:hypothetical protein